MLANTIINTFLNLLTNTWTKRFRRWNSIIFGFSFFHFDWFLLFCGLTWTLPPITKEFFFLLELWEPPELSRKFWSAFSFCHGDGSFFFFFGYGGGSSFSNSRLSSFSSFLNFFLHKWFFNVICVALLKLLYFCMHFSPENTLSIS